MLVFRQSGWYCGMRFPQGMFFRIRVHRAMEFLAALSRVAINLVFSCLLKKPNKPKKAKDVKLE